MNKLISVVIPIHNEEKNISPIYKQLADVFQKLKSDYDFELIYVDDGSSDKSRLEISGICKSDSQVKGVLLSRNFGKEIALTAGIELATGEAVITMDGDGQHPADKIPLFLKEWESGHEIVYNKRDVYSGVTIVKRMSSKLFYFLFNLISEFKLEEGATDYRLLDRKVVTYFLQFREKNRSYRGLTDWMGFHKKVLVFSGGHRQKNQIPSYTYPKLFKLALDNLTGFSLFPLKLVGYLGILITTITSLLAVYILLDKFFLGNFFNFTNISVVIVFNTWIMGIVLISLGFIALYIGNIHEEVLRRPVYMIRDKINFK